MKIEADFQVWLVEEAVFEQFPVNKNIRTNLSLGLSIDMENVIGFNQI